MPEVITFPDPIAAVVSYLNAALTSAGDSARASSRVPAPRPNRFVRVQNTGANRVNLVIMSAQVTVECWEADEVAAFGLGMTVYGLLNAFQTVSARIPAGDDGWLSGPYFQPDPDSRAPRYVMTALVELSAL